VGTCEVIVFLVYSFTLLLDSRIHNLLDGLADLLFLKVLLLPLEPLELVGALVPFFAEAAVSLLDVGVNHRDRL